MLFAEVRDGSGCCCLETTGKESPCKERLRTTRRDERREKGEEQATVTPNMMLLLMMTRCHSFLEPKLESVNFGSVTFYYTNTPYPFESQTDEEDEGDAKRRSCFLSLPLLQN